MQPQSSGTTPSGTTSDTSPQPLPASSLGLQILIAGCGDLGLRAAHLLAGQGTVWGLRRHPPGPDGDTAAGAVRWIAADLADPASLAGLPARIDRVLYCPTPGARTAEAYRRVFLDGLRHLHAQPALRHVQRTVFVSSSAVYGEHQGGWVDEDTPCEPLGDNGRILLAAEDWLREHVPGSVALRLAGLYGPGRLGLLARLRAGTAHAPRTPTHWANRMHIEDAARAAVNLLQLPQPASVYLGCDDTPLPLHVLYEHLAGLLHAPPVPEGPPPPRVGSKRLDNRRLKSTGFTLRWPDARQGYAALMSQAGAMSG